MKPVTLFIRHHEQDHFERACEDLDVPFVYIGEHAGMYSECYAKYSLDITNPATLFSLGRLSLQYQASMTALNYGKYEN